MLQSLLRNRLLHFCFAGGALFALAPSSSRTIELSGKTLSALHAAEASRAGPLGETKRREVDARAIEDELLYREALRLSLDKDDPIVRQRLIQKLLLLTEDLGGASRPPSEAELRAYFNANRARFNRPEELRFIHVFAAHKEALPPLDALAADARVAPPLGEAFPQPRDVTASRDEIARDYGVQLRDVLERSGAAWSEPVASPFGWHRVRLVERVPAAPASFTEVRKRFEVELLLARRQKIVGTYLHQLAGRYDIRVDGQPVHGFVPTVRVAQRNNPSAED